MMTDELIMMLDKFEAGTGKTPTKIICGEAAFEKLRCEAIDDWGADRYLEPNNRDGYIAQFMGIPIQVTRDNNVLENDKIYVLNEPVEDCYKPIRYTQWWAWQPYDDLIVDDLVPPKGFERYYYGQWNTAVQKEKELADISEDALMSILNGGGFKAVNNTTDKLM